MRVTKELLSEVLGIEVKGGNIVVQKNLVIFAYADESKWGHINIYELAHKCKKWCFNNGWVLQVRTGNTLSVVDIFYSENQEFDIKKQIIENTEPEAIFKACQWILETKKELIK